MMGIAGASLFPRLVPALGAPELSLMMAGATELAVERDATLLYREPSVANV